MVVSLILGLLAAKMGRNMLVRGRQPSGQSSPTSPVVVLRHDVGAGAVLTLGHTLQRWLEPVVGSAESAHAVPAWVTTALALAAVVIGVSVAVRQYANQEVPRNAPRDVSALTVAARRDLYGDAVNERVFMHGGRQITRALTSLDETAVEGLSTGVVATVRTTSDGLRGLQTGFARSYALSMLAGAALIAGAILAVTAWR